MDRDEIGSVLTCGDTLLSILEQEKDDQCRMEIHALLTALRLYSLRRQLTWIMAFTFEEGSCVYVRSCSLMYRYIYSKICGCYITGVRF